MTHPESNFTSLCTDLYELTMLQSYVAARMRESATFELFVRRLPAERGFLMAAGLEQALDYLQALRFTESDLHWIRSCGRFTPDFADWLGSFRFTGDVDALPEGTVFFPDEPILRVTAPITEAQFVESRLMNLIHFQTVVASKAARCVLAAPNRTLVDFGFRRAHGAEAGLLAARATYLAGFDGTATAAAAPLFGVPVYGTMAHSFVQAHPSETAAFEAFIATQPSHVTLLIDTYDTERAAHTVVDLVRRLGPAGRRVVAVRIDSGDLAEHARRVRAIFDQAGLNSVRILASGNLDEYALRQLTRSGAPIDSFGVGTRIDTSSDAPYLDCAYKLVEYAGNPTRKLSPGKATWPGRKQVFRFRRPSGVFARDVVTLDGDSLDGEPLLLPVMRQGARVGASPALSGVRSHASAQLHALPEHLRDLGTVPPYPAEISVRVRDLAARLFAAHRGQGLLEPAPLAVTPRGS